MTAIAAPRDTRRPGDTVLAVLSAVAARSSGKTAIRHLRSAATDDAPIAIDYATLVDRIRRAATLFRDAAGAEHPVVAIILPMIPEALIATWGAVATGIAVPINPFLDVVQAAGIMNSAGATVLVTATDAFGSGTWSNLAELQARVPNVRETFVIDAPDPAHDFMDCVQRVDPADDPANDDPDRDAIYLPTGGTTGAPKLVRMTQAGMLRNAWAIGSLMGSAESDVVGHALPLFHVGGLVTIALRAFAYGQTLVTLTTPGFRDPEVIRTFWSVLLHNGVTTIVITPTTAAALVAMADAPATLSLNACFCGGSALPTETAAAFAARFGVTLRESWGLSEAYGIVTSHGASGHVSSTGSVGQPLPSYIVRAVVVDSGNRFIRFCEAGERGVIAVGGPAVTPGYLDPSLNAELTIEGIPDTDAWINTGDLGTVDAQGDVWIFGRAKDLIIRGGHNIDPRAIEDVLSDHPAVQLAAAVGQPDQAKGELPVAYVQLRPGYTTTVETLLDHCRHHMQERAAIPRWIYLQTLPLTPVGKIFKPALRDDATRRAIDRIVDEVLDGASRREIVLLTDGPKLHAVVTIEAQPERTERLRVALAGFAFEVSVVSA